MILLLSSFQQYGWKQHDNDSSHVVTNICVVGLSHTAFEKTTAIQKAIVNLKQTV